MSHSSNTKVGLLQFAPQRGNISANIDKIDNLLSNSEKADIWVLPELASSGYNFSTFEEAMACSEELDNSEFITFLNQKAQSLNTWIVSGINERDGDKLYNSAVLISPDGLEGIYRKLHLFNREKLFFTPGNMGIPLFDTPFGKIGILVCFDWMFPEVWRIMALKGAQLICHPSNLVLPFCQSAMPGISLNNRIFIATTNRIGKDGDLEFTGQSVFVNPKGEYLLNFTENEEAGKAFEINLNEALEKQMTPMNDAFDDRREDIYTLGETPNTPSLQQQKKSLRKHIRKLKKQYTLEALKAIGFDVIHQLEKIPEFQKAKKIFIYWSLPNEVPTHEFIEKWRKEKTFILPRIVGDHLELREYTGIESLTSEDSFGIEEPTGPVACDLDIIDLAIVPGIAFTENGFRMGRGGGYYDRTLPFLEQAQKIGLAFPFQMVDKIPIEAHDIPLDRVIYKPL
ncbi:5-formyltetrahydrofolate cyclo-ligase [Marinilabilia rubra]|uniref:5-formyltetrahydrofolate cyclo-ligase n=1 Tax=Marinilabilia rubra TaxID=2162893 RepID=A0A2U2B8B8_9BACT|nr:5-formyltetrahydrofolate cyclo-ligase [Marinilabilia rubra]PWD99307.1 5-formyltetrahydrofolate cyclo-ligase [Marinilabilia rubra]